MDTSVEDGVGGVLVASFDAGESLLARSGSLVDHAGGLRVERAREGVGRSVANAAQQRERSALRVVAEEDTIARFAPSFHGELAACTLADGPVHAVTAAFLAATGDASIGAGNVGPSPARGQGLFLTTVSGTGTAYVAGRGRVERVALGEGTERTVAAPHVVAFERRVDVDVRSATAVDDAAVTCRLRGPGRIWVATRPHER